MTDVNPDGEWSGWQLRGRHLVSEDSQRMTVERLRGLMWRDKMELRLKGYASRRAAEEARHAASRPQLVKVVIVNLAQFRHGCMPAS
ncbi:hypothetical protein [Lysobacter sp. FW306-1B-D06B]|uniref:hypothetical protein n=1 Tax=Lysobacter sp. FW306-1B-D06B TaxID=3140250 RepID=UPI0031405DDA